MVSTARDAPGDTPGARATPAAPEARSAGAGRLLAAGPHRLFASPGSDQSSTAVDTRTRVLGYVNVEEMVYYASASPSDLLGLGQREKPIVTGRRELQGPGRDRTDMALAESVEHVIEHLPGDAVTLREVLDVIGREGMLVFCIFLALPFMVPVSIPGVSTAFGLVMGLIGVGIMADRHPWLPDPLMRKRFPADRLRLALEKGSVWIHRLGRISRPSSRPDARDGNGAGQRADADRRRAASHGSLRLDPVLQYASGCGHPLPGYRNAAAGRPVHPPWIRDHRLVGALLRLPSVGRDSPFCRA